MHPRKQLPHSIHLKRGEASQTRRYASRSVEDEYQIRAASSALGVSGDTLQDVEDGAQGIPDSPANGYYEWQKNEDGTKTPHYLHGEDEEQLLGFAGLYEFWPDPTKAEDAEDKWLVTATILTRAAHDALGHIHDRTPVIIPGNLHDQWLDPTMTERDQVQHFIDTIPEPNLVPRIVGKDVGSVRNNGPQLIQPAEQST